MHDKSRKDFLLSAIAEAEKHLSTIDGKRHRIIANLNSLRKELQSLNHDTTVVKDTSALQDKILSKTSSPEEKIALFRDIFRGRDDVYPRLWTNKKTGKAGYSPVCNNEWVAGMCEKPRIKCGKCKNRSFASVTDNVIREHLEGKHIIGIYPMLTDETCWFLAIDFDKESWEDDVSAFMETSRKFKIPAVLERSRSGKGAHVWIFFSNPTSASAARRLGCYLLTETMTMHHQIEMDSYDRLFPNQDTMPKGGFGNLIALPFQKEACKNGNTLFLDQGLKPYDDQWYFLSRIQKMTASDVEIIVSEAEQKGQIINVKISQSDEDNEPWRQPQKFKEKPIDLPLPDKIEMVISNLIYIEKKGLPSKILTRIKQTAAFQNPEFYKKQRMRFSTALTPRVISCAEDFPEKLAIPRGCLPEIEELFKIHDIKIDMKDERYSGKEIDVSFYGKLNSSQYETSQALVNHENGILVAPPGFGKTIVGTYLISMRKKNTLILVHRSALLEQWQVKLANLLNMSIKEIGVIGGGKNKPTGIIDVAMFQSLFQKREVNDMVSQYGHVIVDECHHVSAFSFEQVLRRIRARFILGLTATPYRRDGHQSIILMQCGPIRYKVSQKESTKNILQHQLICRYTKFSIPSMETGQDIHHIYDRLIGNEERNQMIFDDVLQVIEEGRSPILLTERKEHLEILAKKFYSFVRNVITLKGGMRVKERKSIMEKLAAIPDGEERLLLATGRYIGEGFDDARLDTLFLVMPVSWKGTLVQYAGRLHRIYQGKKEVKVYDYIDSNLPMLMNMFKKRFKGYKALGYEIV
ncbi:MAG: restriction endonuclease subunit R [Nitrospinae bacterium RIFCSPLOWO2_12_39_16]|nr:MAG: restriction endonuclease subunit R [Nitrospinae bacterium RIFCSPLOWO2_02_39_17]OGW08755.1 MAG: restriction endonuclease subunit R [Nitrospinae bacterium RIFCSPLOWO2_12_39_16]HLA48430.1 DEAD/DEAH box helicase family protein [Nitrospinota bacterium]